MLSRPQDRLRGDTACPRRRSSRAAQAQQDLPVAAVLGKLRVCVQVIPAWETARVNILRLVLLGLAGLAGIVIGAALMQKAIRPETSSAPLIATASTRPGGPGMSPYEIDAARRAFTEKLKTAPEYAAFFDRLKTVFPSEYESFLAAFAQRSAASGEIASADLLIAEAARSLRLSRGILAAKAGRQALEHIFELHFAMLRALAAIDPRLCVNFLYGGESPGFFEFSAQNRGLVAAMAIKAA